LSCELTNLPEAIPLLNCVVGISESSLIRFFAIKSTKKAISPPFEVLDQVHFLSGELSSLSEAIQLLICVAGVSEPSLFCFLAIKLAKKANFPPFELLDQVYLLSSESLFLGILQATSELQIVKSSLGDSCICTCKKRLKEILLEPLIYVLLQKSQFALTLNKFCNILLAKALTACSECCGLCAL